ncbi:hypothetical protein QUA82_28945 [Microcoleus sp. F8-D3]
MNIGKKPGFLGQRPSPIGRSGGHRDRGFRAIGRSGISGGVGAGLFDLSVT